MTGSSGSTPSPVPRAARTGALAAEALAVGVDEVEGLVEVGTLPEETADDVVTRMLGALEDIADLYRGEAVLVVGHLAAIGLTLPHLLDGTRSPDPGLDPGAWLALEGDADGWVLRAEPPGPRPEWRDGQPRLGMPTFFCYRPCP